MDLSLETHGSKHIYYIPNHLLAIINGNTFSYETLSYELILIFL